jgi:hypothetical protein
MRSPKPAPSLQRVVTVSMPDLLPPGLAQSLAEVGFLAIDQKDWPRARQIFSVLMAFRVQSEFPYVGMSMAELLQGRGDSAAQWAKLGLVRVPESRALAELVDMSVGKGVRP